MFKHNVNWLDGYLVKQVSSHVPFNTCFLVIWWISKFVSQPKGIHRTEE